MSKNGKRGGGDRVLESRHLVLLFLSVVLLCGVFFTLGYVMGHTQYGGSVHAEAAPTTHSQPQPLTPVAKSKQPATASPSTSSDKNGWGSDETTTPDNVAAPAETKPEAKPAPRIVTTSTPSKPNAKPAPPAEKQPAKYNPPPNVGKNSIVLQVAAVKQQRDALEVADELQKKKFPAFVVSNQADGFYRVQLGPYPDKASADAARHALEQAGFKAIIKR